MTTVEQPLAERQARLKQQYRDEPRQGRQTSAAFSITGDSDDPTRVRIAVDGCEGAVLEMAAHRAVGGTHDVPCSGDILMAALAGCQEITLRMVAAAIGLPLSRLEVRVEGDWDARGTLGVDRETPVAFTAIRVHVTVETDAPPDKVERLLKSAERYCVVGATLRGSPEITFEASVTLPAGAGHVAGS